MSTEKAIRSWRLLVLLAMFWLNQPLGAFSLLGPFTSWQDASIGYDLPIGGNESGGPMNLGEEYRSNLPFANYAYDSTFLNYFGAKGMVAIDEAFEVLNDLPTAEQIDLNDFPLQAKGPVNFTAANLNIVDLKSISLGLILGQFGVGSPERWTWVLRDRSTPAAGLTNYLVIQRNFDPFNFQPTNAVNGTIYTYTIFDPIQIVAGSTYADAVERPIDPSAIDFTTLAGINNVDPLRAGNLGAGEYFTGLTREDAAALKYIYRYDNKNIEGLSGGGGGGAGGGGAGGGGGGAGGVGNITLSSNAPNQSPFFGVPGTTNAFQTNALVNQAIRPGMGKIWFRKVQFDSLVGTTLSVTNEFLDRYITNNLVLLQRLERNSTAPDILFRADDLGVLNSEPFLISRSVASGNFVDNSALNSSSGTGGGLGGEIYGPGTIDMDIVISFSRLGPYRLNQFPFFLDENQSFAGGVFGHFDTTTIFAVFPDSASVSEIEELVGSSGTVGTGLSPF